MLPRNKEKAPRLVAAKQTGRSAQLRQAKLNALIPGSKCSCGCTLPVGAWFVDEWLPELHMLAARFEGSGITPDLAAMCLCQCYGAFLFLARQGG